MPHLHHQNIEEQMSKDADVEVVRPGRAESPEATKRPGLRVGGRVGARLDGTRPEPKHREVAHASN